MSSKWTGQGLASLGARRLKRNLPEMGQFIDNPRVPILEAFVISGVDLTQSAARGLLTVG